MMDEILIAFLGIPPTPQDRAIYADQLARLRAIADNPLLPPKDGLQKSDPLGAGHP
ncbi:MAG: hypothetical protein II336_19615 [Loktanella sp.]|nr:hypothetical protein [Loktanella sp.]